MNTQIASTIFDIYQKPVTVSPSSTDSETVEIPTAATPPPATKEEINVLHLKFQACGKNAREWMQKCKMLLPEIKEKEVWKRKGFSSIYEYARVLAGMSTFAVDDALWVMKKLEGKPSLKKVANEKGLNAVRPVLTVATEDDEKEWAKMATELSHHALRIYVEEVKRNSPVCHDFDQKESCDVTGQNSKNRMSKSIYMKLDVKTIERMKRLKGDIGWDEMLNEMLDAYEKYHAEQKLESGDTARHCETQEKPAPVNTGKRYIPNTARAVSLRGEIRGEATIKYVTKQTSGLCAFPGCSKPYGILHHTKRFALDTTHDPDTIKPLCKAHERLAHKGLIEGEEKCPVNWALRKQPDKTSRKYGIDKKVNHYYVPRLE